VLAGTLAGLLATVLFMLLSLASWRRLLKPAATGLLLLAAPAAHFMWTYGVVIDSGVAASAVQTDWREALGLLTPALVLAVLLGAGLPALLVWRAPLIHRPWPRQLVRNGAAIALGALLFAALVLASFQPLASAMRNHKHLRYLMNPLSTLYAAGQLGLGGARPRGALEAIGQDAQLRPIPGGRPPLLVLVVGETGRSGNFGLNGYGADTTPELARAGAASFRNAWSCGTHTAASVPCMFSHRGREAFLARDGDAENLLDVLQHAGLAVLWIDNQPGGCKGVCDRVAHVNTSAARSQPLCGPHGCHDEILLQGLDQRLAALPEPQRARGVVLVLHPMGSHGPDYAHRTPPAFKRFLPECASAHLPDCSSEELRNAYDNTIAYTDHVLGGTIRWLQSRTDYDGALLYVADHGESLGENNLYLHGLPYALAPDVQKHVPWITWLSPAFAHRAGVAMECLRERADARITHDHLFHSVLGLLKVETSVYRRALDAYAACEAH
jgi:lipid A ethanolaminephosphotransferase